MTKPLKALKAEVLMRAGQFVVGAPVIQSKGRKIVNLRDDKPEPTVPVLVRELEHSRKQVLDWRNRAIKAEKQIAAMRKLLW